MKKISTKTSHIITTSVVCFVAVGLGVGLGVFFGMKYLVPEVQYDFSFEYLEDDVDSLMDRYEKCNGDYTDFKGYELVNIATYKYDSTNYHYSYTDGYVIAAGITQTIKSTSIRHNNSYFNESISASPLVQVAKRFYQKDNANTIDLYNGSSIQNGSSATWSNDPQISYNFKNYEETWGKQLSRSSIYIISSKTVLNSSFVFENNQYVVDIELDPILSVGRYVKQMKEMSNLERYPSFKKINIKFTLDSQLNLISRQVSEQYEVYMLGFHMSDSVINDYYFPNEMVEIPDLTTNCIYERKE